MLIDFDFHSQLDCCGNVGYKDYLLPPRSCYNSETYKLNLEGCRQKFLDYIAERWTAFNIFSLILVGVEVVFCFPIIFVCINIYLILFLRLFVLCSPMCWPIVL